MIIFTIQHSMRHRSRPIREDVVWRCNNAISYAQPRHEIENSRSDTGCLHHLSEALVRSNGLIFASRGREIIQIPIGRCLR
jgi:hypothetical protein